MHDWQSFLWTADEWFVNYSSVPVGLTSVTTFSIGHAVELYLKATYTKLTGNICEAIKFGHNIKALWDACKRLDSSFMQDYEIRDSVFNSDICQTGLENRLSRDDFEQYGKNQELYLLAKVLPDLKYLGAPLKSIKGAFSFGYVHPNQYWIDFFKELRSYLGHPSEDRLDFVKHKLDEGDLPERSKLYLQGLYR